jgi:hypothetical protein
LALTAAVSAMAASGLTIGTVKPMFAEFEIRESTVEKGEKFEYRGAVHWGFPKTEREDAGEKQNGGAAAEDEEEEGPLRQSHDFEFSYGLTDRWLFSTTLTADEPLDEDFALSSVELELQYELIEMKTRALAWRFLEVTASPLGAATLTRSSSVRLSSLAPAICR